MVCPPSTAAALPPGRAGSGHAARMEPAPGRAQRPLPAATTPFLQPRTHSDKTRKVDFPQCSWLFFSLLVRGQPHHLRLLGPGPDNNEDSPRAWGAAAGGARGGGAGQRAGSAAHAWRQGAQGRHGAGHRAGERAARHLRWVLSGRRPWLSLHGGACVPNSCGEGGWKRAVATPVFIRAGARACAVLTWPFAAPDPKKMKEMKCGVCQATVMEMAVRCARAVTACRASAPLVCRAVCASDLSRTVGYSVRHQQTSCREGQEAAGGGSCRSPGQDLRPEHGQVWSRPRSRWAGSPVRTHTYARAVQRAPRRHAHMSHGARARTCAGACACKDNGKLLLMNISGHQQPTSKWSNDDRQLRAKGGWVTR